MVNTMSETPASSEKAEFNRLWWHSRRGMLELDNLLIPFMSLTVGFDIDLLSSFTMNCMSLLSCDR